MGPGPVLPTCLALPRPDLRVGTVQVEGFGDCLVLDGELLLADPQLSGSASVAAGGVTGPLGYRY